MSNNELLAAVSVVLSEIIKIKKTTKRKNRKIWTRNQEGAYEARIKELRAGDPLSFMNLLKMNTDMFDVLLEKVGRNIQKNDTVMRQAIPANVKLEIACRFLATGDSLASLQNLYWVPKCSISKFLPEVFLAIYEGLKEFIQSPSTESQWDDIQKGFNDLWKFPHCVGCIDGKHVLVQCPTNSGSQYFNYKGTFSIELLAMVDHDYNFTFIDIGSYGSVADDDIFAKSSFMRAIEQNQINMPKGAVILGDMAFPLKPYLMKPYSAQDDLSAAQKIYNYRHSHARRIIENAFGILTSRFRVFKTPIHLQPETVVKLVKATLALHNWIRKTKNEVMTVDSLDHEYESGRIIPGSWHNADRAGGMTNFIPSQDQNDISEGRERRDEFARYFVEEGAETCQYQMIQ